MKFWQYEILDKYPAFDGWLAEFNEAATRGAKYRARYSKSGVGSIYLFFSEDLALIDCAGTLDFYFQIKPQDLKWDLDFIIGSAQVKRWH